jgi:hypothetical protein
MDDFASDATEVHEEEIAYSVLFFLFDTSRTHIHKCFPLVHMFRFHLINIIFSSISRSEQIIRNFISHHVNKYF